MVRLFALMLIMMRSAFAVELHFQVDPSDLSVGQAGSARLIVVGGKAASPPVIGDSGTVRLSYVGSSSRTQMTNQGVSSYTQYNYQVIPLEVGQFELGPVEVEVDGATYRSGSQTLRVRPAPDRKQLNVRVEGEFLQDVAWEGQVVVFRYALVSEPSILKSPNWDLDEFAGLRPPRDGDRPQRVDTVSEKGKTLQRIQRWMPMVVMGGQSRTYRSAIAKTVVRPTENSQPEMRLFIGEPIELTVRPLPQSDEPFSGLVGDFKIESTLDRTSVKAGESISWAIRISGDGTLEALSMPKFDTEIPVQVYDGSTTASASVLDGKYSARLDIERTIVPVSDGTLQLPPLTVRAFSPKLGRYVDHRLEFPTVEVAPGSLGDGAALSFAPQESVSAELPQAEPLKPPRYSLRAHRSGISGWWVAISALFALVGFGVLGRDAVRTIGVWLEQRRARVKKKVSRRDLVLNFPSEAPSQLAHAEQSLRWLEEALKDEQGASDVRARCEAFQEAIAQVRYAGGELQFSMGEIHAFIEEHAEVLS